MSSGTSSPPASSAGSAELRAAAVAPALSLSIPSRESLLRLAWRLETRAGLAVVFGLALVLRLALAPRVGFYGDLQLFQKWAARLADVGPHRFYGGGGFVDYPPGYLYVLWLLGTVSAAPGYLLLKLPAICADLGLAWVAGTLAVRVAPAQLRERVPVRALVAVAVLFNPAVIAIGAGWGQVDAVPSLFALGAILLVATGQPALRREVGGFALLAVAVAMKPQAGFVLPVLCYALYRRHLRGRRGGALLDGALAAGLSGALALALWAVSGLAFGLGPLSLLRFYRTSASVYPVTSANAFNLWGALGFWRPDKGGPAYVGTAAFLVALALVLARAHRALERGADEARVLLASSAAVSLLAFTLLTRMHERYLFLALVCLTPLVVERRLRRLYGALSALFVLQLWYPYAYFNSQWDVDSFRVQPLFGWLLGGFATDTIQKTIWSLVLTGVALATVRAALAWAEVGAAPAPPRRLLVGWPRAAELAQGRFPLALIGLACVFGLVTLRGETVSAPPLNDSAFHMQMVRWASGQISEGRVPLDGWFPDLSLGSSFFHRYQSLAEILTAYAAHLTGLGVTTTYLWLLYLLLALWPVSVYASARLLGWERWPAAAAAAISPFVVSAPGYGFEHTSYTWAGYGVYSQLWAMWLLPLAWGLTWRAVADGRRYASAALAVALTIAVHFITGYLALLTIGVWVLVLGIGPGLARRAGRAAVAGVGALLVAAWVLVPLVGDTATTTHSAFYDNTYYADSFGARKVLRWLFTGQLFDHGRSVPVLTLLAGVGFGVCVARARTDRRARALLGAFTLSLLLFFGRPTLGPLLGLLPGFSDVQIHRFLMGVQLGGILLAGVGLVALVRVVVAAAQRLAPFRSGLVAGTAAFLLAVGALVPAAVVQAEHDRAGSSLIRLQQGVDRTDGRDLDRLVAIATKRGGGRIYAGLRGNWGRDYEVGYVPVYALLADRDVDAVGFTFRTIASLSTDVEAAFDETNPAEYRMLGIRYLLYPSDRKPAVPATLIASSGRHRLYELRDSGYFRVVDRGGSFAADRFDLERATRSWRTSSLAARDVYASIAFAGAAPLPPSFGGSEPPAGAPGRVLSQAEKPADGRFAATVRARRTSVVLLSASYDPRWRATVDGAPAQPEMIAPSLVGVQVPPGKHVVRFHYSPYPGYPLLLVLGAATLFVLAAGPRARARRAER